MTLVNRRDVLAMGGLGAVGLALQQNSLQSAQAIATMEKRRDKIALEEHFSIEELLPTQDELTFFNPKLLDNIEPLLPELSEKRLDKMNKSGIEIAVLSQTGPGIQGVINAHDASDLAIRANNALHRAVQQHPKRFRGFAALNLQETDAACSELKRCVNELGFVGALVNGSTQGIYLDDARLDPLWTTLEELDVPLYLHPGIPTDQPESMVEELEGATWAWSFDTATHALRLIVKGIFEKHPRAKVILGHMGENLPFYLWRLDSRYAITKYQNNLSQSPSTIFRNHFFITTSGVCDNGALLCSIASMGANRIMFATDYPYEDIVLAGSWIDEAPIDPEAKTLITHGVAQELLHLG